ncbi:MAG: ATP-binding protein [Christensenellales bacterium]
MNSDIIRLSVPAKPDYILAVRLVVSAVAERVGFDIEDIEDLKVASAEACTMLLAAEPESIELCVTVNNGLFLKFVAAGKAAGVAADREANGELSQYLLDALVDECDFISGGGAVSAVTLNKRLP